jgi:hypothetical protein
MRCDISYLEKETIIALYYAYEVGIPALPLVFMRFGHVS